MKWTDDLADYFKKVLSKPIGDKSLVIPMDFKYAANPSVKGVIPPADDTAEKVMQSSPWNCRGGINIHIPTAKDTMKYGKTGLSASFAPIPASTWATYSVTSSYATYGGASGPNTGGLWGSVGSGKVLSASWSGPNFSTTASYASGFDPSWVGAISGRYTMAPCMDGYLSVTVNLGDPSSRKATVSFRNEELTKMVWLNNNVDVVTSALMEFNKLVNESSGAGNKPWFNCVIKGEGVTYDPKRIVFTGLSYKDCVIQAGLTHRVDIEGQDPMKVLTEIATSYKFFLVGDMEVDEDEGKIEGFFVEELWAINPQTRMNELIFKV